MEENKNTNSERKIRTDKVIDVVATIKNYSINPEKHIPGLKQLDTLDAATVSWGCVQCGTSMRPSKLLRNNFQNFNVVLSHILWWLSKSMFFHYWRNISHGEMNSKQTPLRNQMCLRHWKTIWIDNKFPVVYSTTKLLPLGLSFF